MDQSRRNFFRSSAVVAKDFAVAGSSFYAASIFVRDMTKDKFTPPTPYMKLIGPATLMGGLGC